MYTYSKPTSVQFRQQLHTYVCMCLHMKTRMYNNTKDQLKCPLQTVCTVDTLFTILNVEVHIQTKCIHFAKESLRS